MSDARHRAKRRAPLRNRAHRYVLPAALATSMTAAAVGFGVTVADADPSPARLAVSAAAARLSPTAVSSLAAAREQSPSRTAKRVSLQPKAAERLQATAELNVWTGPGEKFKQDGVVPFGTDIAVTGQVVDNWAEVLIDGKVRWVNADYLVDPESAAAAGVTRAPCPDGSGTESGLTSNAVTLYRAVCAAFPALSSYGGRDGHGEHASGRAIDFVVSDRALGQAVADWIRAHATELHIYDVIYWQRIFTQERGAEGWRGMSNRGSATANHFDHVHASVY